MMTVLYWAVCIAGATWLANKFIDFVEYLDRR